MIPDKDPKSTIADPITKLKETLSKDKTAPATSVTIGDRTETYDALLDDVFAISHKRRPNATIELVTSHPKASQVVEICGKSIFSCISKDSAKSVKPPVPIATVFEASGFTFGYLLISTPDKAAKMLAIRIVITEIIDELVLS